MTEISLKSGDLNIKNMFIISRLVIQTWQKSISY